MKKIVAVLVIFVFLLSSFILASSYAGGHGAKCGIQSSGCPMMKAAGCGKKKSLRNHLIILHQCLACKYIQTRASIKVCLLPG